MRERTQTYQFQKDRLPKLTQELIDELNTPKSTKEIKFLFTG